MSDREEFLDALARGQAAADQSMAALRSSPEAMEALGEWCESTDRLVRAGKAAGMGRIALHSLLLGAGLAALDHLMPSS